MVRNKFLAGLAICVLSMSFGAQARADDAASKEADAKLYQQTVDRGVEYLLTKGVQEDGSYGKDLGPGMASICTAAVLRQRPLARRSGGRQESEMDSRRSFTTTAASIRPIRRSRTTNPRWPFSASPRPMPTAGIPS